MPPTTYRLLTSCGGTAMRLSLLTSLRTGSKTECSRVADRFSPPVLDILRRAGWFDGRRVAVVPSPGIRLFPKAHEVLAEFGGLRMGKCGAGMECATSDVQIEPGLATHLTSELHEAERSLNTRLFPLGEVHRGHGYLIIDEYGRTYLLSDKLSPFAPTFSRCLELLLLGKKANAAELEAAWKSD